MKNILPHSLRRCRKGSTAIEFAIVAPVLFLLLIGVIETGLIFMTNNALEAATGIGARIGKIGYTEHGMTREQYIRNQIYTLSGGFLDQRRLNVSMLSYKGFGDIGQKEPFTDKNGNGVYDIGEPFQDINGNGKWDKDQGAASSGGGGQVVFYQINYSWPLFTPIMRTMMGDRRGNINISATATVRNEAF